MTNPGFKDNWDFQEELLPRIKSIIHKCAGQFVKITIAEPPQDMKEATDMVVSIDMATGGEIAIRIRRDDTDYRDLTIRSYNNGSKTELQKIREGFARWYLYVWKHKTDDGLDWIFVDVDKMRSAGLMNVQRKEIPNYDNGATRFVNVSLLELIENDCIIEYSLSLESWAIALRRARPVPVTRPAISVQPPTPPPQPPPIPVVIPEPMQMPLLEAPRWNQDTQAGRVFLSHCNEAHGLNDREVLQALGVEKLEDFIGTMDEADGLCMSYVARAAA